MEIIGWDNFEHFFHETLEIIRHTLSQIPTPISIPSITPQRAAIHLPSALQELCYTNLGRVHANKSSSPPLLSCPWHQGLARAREESCCT
jgi:hypothetical protein